MGVATMRVPTIFTAVDRFSDVVKKMTGANKAFGESASAAASRIGNKMTSVGKSMMLTSSVMLASLVIPLKKATEFEDQIASIGTLLPELDAKGLNKLGDDIMAIAQKTSTPLEELTKSFYDLISAGENISSAKSMIKSINKLSIAGLGSLTEATDIQLAAMRNFKTSFKDSDEAANALFKTVKYGVTTVQKLSESFSANAGFAGDLGVTGQEFLSSIAAITTSKMPTSQAEIGIGSMTNAIAKTTANKNKILFSIFKKIGVNNGQDLIKKQGGLLPALMKIKDVAKKAGINMQSVFGEKRASNAFMKLTNNTAVIDKYNESLKHINDKGEDSIGKAYMLKMATGKFGIGMLRNNLDAVAITIGTTLIPAILDLTSILIPMLKDFRDWSKENKWAVKWFAIIAVGIGAIGAAVTAGGWIVKLYGFFKYLGSIGWISTIIDGISVSLGLAGVAFELTFGVAFSTVMAVVGAIALLIWWMVDLVKYWDAVVNAFKSEGILAAFNKIVDVLINVILKALVLILEVIGKIPLIGSPFEGWAKDLSQIQKDYEKFALTDKISPVAASITTPLSQSPINRPKNLAGSNNPMQSLVSSLNGGNGGVLTINLNDPGKQVNSVDESQVKGIKVETSSTKHGR